MGKYSGNCEGLTGEIAVVGVKTQARAASFMAASTTSSSAATITSSPAKKIKKTTSSPYRLRNRRRSLSVTEEENATANYSKSEVITFALTSSRSSEFPPCCSSNGNGDDLSKSDVVKDRCVVDPEIDNGEASTTQINCRTTTVENEARNESTKSDGHDSSSPDSTPTVQLITTKPSDSEIEAFFSAANKDFAKRFMEKYNFDIVNDLPLEGRYEWVRINS